jgi:hypothetical protein
VEKLDYRSFRGSISGLSFAYCDFYQHNPRAQLTSGNALRPPAPPAATSTPTPIATSLRPALEE